MRKTIHRSATDGNHLAIGLVIVPEIVLLRFALDNVEKELLKLLIARASPQRFHDVELQIAAKTWAQLPIARQAKFVAAFAEMQIRHRPDKANALSAPGNLIIGSRTIRAEFRLRDQISVTRFD